MKPEIISSTQALHDLASEWEELWRRDLHATPFQSPHWLLPWWEHFGSGELTVLVSRDGGRLQSLVPLYVVRDDDESLGLLLGTGISDYLDALGSPQGFDQLQKIDCQLWDLQQLRASSSLLSAKAPPSWSETVEEQDPCLVLTLSERIASTHFQKKLRYYTRVLERQGEVTWQTPTLDSLDEMMSALFALHAARWEQRGLPGVLADAVVQQFHRDVARRMLAAGALRLYALMVGSRCAGVFYGFAHQGTVSYYLSGYDPSLETLSVGTLLVAHAVEQAVREEAHTFDFLRGAEEYKYAWGAKDRVSRRRQLIRG